MKDNTMRLLTLLLSLFIVSSANALTIPEGHVIGPDGNLYKHASPEQLKIIMDNDKTSGIHGRSLYIKLDGKVTFIELKEFLNKSNDQIESIVMAHVLSDIVDIPVEEIKSALTENNNNIERAVEEAVETVDTRTIQERARDILETADYQEARKTITADVVNEISRDILTEHGLDLEKLKREHGITYRDIIDRDHYQSVIDKLGETDYRKAKHDKIKEIQSSVGIR